LLAKRPAVLVDFIINGVNYDSATNQQKDSIRHSVMQTFADEIGVKPNDVGVILSAGSVKVDATIQTPVPNETHSQISTKAATLKSSMVTSVSKLELPKTGQISINNMAALVAPAPAPLPKWLKLPPHIEQPPLPPRRPKLPATP
jgi:hypothetical protein